MQIDEPCPQSCERSLRDAALAVSDVHLLVCRSMCRAVVRCHIFTRSNIFWRISNIGSALTRMLPLALFR